MAKKPKQPVRAPCPSCGPDRLADIVGEHVQKGEEEESEIWWITTHRLLQCRGCESVFVVRENVFSEDEEEFHDPRTGEWHSAPIVRKTYWPSPAKRKQPEWLLDFRVLNDPISSLLDELYSALDGDLRVLAAMGIRTVFDRGSEMLGVDPSLQFNQKLDALKDIGRVSQHERDLLDVLTDAGGAAAHRGWKPSLHDLTTMMDILEAFLHRNLVLGDAAAALRSRVPAKPARTKKLRQVP